MAHSAPPPCRVWSWSQIQFFVKAFPKYIFNRPADAVLQTPFWVTEWLTESSKYFEGFGLQNYFEIAWSVEKLWRCREKGWKLVGSCKGLELGQRRSVLTGPPLVVPGCAIRQSCKNVWRYNQWLCKKNSSLGKIYAKFYAYFVKILALLQFCAFLGYIYYYWNFFSLASKADSTVTSRLRKRSPLFLSSAY